MDVSKWLTSNVVKLLQPVNICLKVVALDVSKRLTANAVKLLQ